MDIKGIARIAGVSTSTVSKIVNHKDESISQETRERVLKVVRDYHYIPYAAVSRQAKSWLIGVLLRTDATFDSTLDGIIQVAQTSGYATLVLSSYSDAKQELRNISALNSCGVGGIIWQPVNKESLASNRVSLEANGVPMLIVGSDDGDKSLLLPYEVAAYKLTLELIKRHHARIGCLMTQGRRAEDFLSGFRHCLFEHSIEYSDDLVFYELNDSLVEKVSSHAITGFISSHYRKALEFHRLMESLQYQVPQDVSLVSIKNDTMQYPNDTKISTYTIRNADFGSYLCGKLISVIEGREEPLSFVQRFHLDNTITLDEPSELRTKKVVVIGCLNMDTYLAVPELPRIGSTVSTDTSATYPGGKGVNQAVGVAKLGQRVSLIGNVGSDIEADYIYREMKRWGVDATGVRRHPQASTGRAYIFVNPNGESMISILLGANASLSPEDIRSQENLFNSAGYCLVQSAVPMTAVRTACQIAHKHHAKTILKPSSCNCLPDDVASEVDILVPNKNELDAICPGDGSTEEKAISLLSRGIESIIVTLGANGCYLCTSNVKLHFPAADFAPVDDTGAGDAFISALVSYLLYGYSLTKAIEIAVYAAGHSVTTRGVIPSLIDRYALETHIKQCGPSI